MFVGERFDLTVLEITHKNIGFQYSEYAPSTRGTWLLKAGFNKRFDFNPEMPIIFKGYEFEVVAIEQGRINYRRVK